jgi:predicted MPP superfamily phosphohydrolase
LWSANLFGVGALLILHFVGSSLCLDALNFILSFFHKRRSIKIGVWKKAYRCGLMPVIITGLIMLYGYLSMVNIKETNYIIHTEKAMREQGYRIAFIADLHFGTTMDEDKLKEYCIQIEEKKPDLVVLVGDIFDKNTTYTEMENAAKLLGNIRSNYGTIYVYGNHDKGRNFSGEEIENKLESSGIRVLEDDIYNIDEDFTVIGRKDRGYSAGNLRKTSAELIKNINTENFLLLLDHQPRDFQQNSSTGIDLQLSGHTHAGQLWPEGLVNEITGIGELNYGYEKLDKFQVIVTSGMAGYGYPVRTGSFSEYVIIDVKR